jgi:hypothetical protein
LINPAAQLRFPPLQVFAQGIAQPVLAGVGGSVRRAIWRVGHGVLCWIGSRPGETMSTATYALAPLPQQKLEVWHRFVATRDGTLLRSLLAETVVFRSPALQTPIPGREAGVLVLTTVATIFENFTYHRTFVGGPHDAALEFSAGIGKWQLKGLDLIKFNEAGELVEFEVMIRPLKALQVLAEEMGNRIGPQLMQMKQMAAPR